MNDSNPLDVTQDLQGNPLRQEDAAPAEYPLRIGRYRIERVLGKGGFGIVYLAQDEQLNRPVAVKVPHAKLISKPADAEMYLAEARTVANLDHPGIVPVHDVGSTEDCPCFVVSKYIPGTDLAAKLKQQRRPHYRDAAELVATVAEALHYAHKQGLVHRDVKPGNILIDEDGKPYVVDFGLALREENVGKGPKYAGTPAYMSPEQARGEGHRVDARSDVFSLGVVFYELLAGRKPFRGDTQAELLEQVTTYEARPPRQYNDNIPKELERICHKAMGKRASERYSTAKDLSDDLRHFVAQQTVIQSVASSGASGGMQPAASETDGSIPVGSTATSLASMNFVTSDNQPIKIVPKGLRSFDAHDADFFLELLPGPRDRDGLPDSLRFWKNRIEEADPDNTFTVGLIYGPSGCGKSSLVKAGLLPRLSEDVIPIYIEATPQETETRLLHGLRKRCPELPGTLILKDTLAALRRGQGIPVGRKVLIVLDQFEQWLHAKKDESSELVQALRQCDGGRVQCIVMVRDDFWMAATRFMRDLEVPLLEAQNSAAVDLFFVRHAEKVLAAFGRAFGTLPDNLNDATNQQKSFIKESVAGLADEGKVICVRLTLFAEMMKGKVWTPAALKEVGGTQGVGVTFLEETFSASTSPPEHRYHQKAARAVLKDLLPDSGTNIKGSMRSAAALLEASGYGGRPKDFDDLIRILDSEIRLITPTDPEGQNVDNDSVTQAPAGQKFFQLTHDYLVPALCQWLTHKQKETRKGRAELKLAERSALWNARPENRYLPSLVEWLNIRALTESKQWTAPQRVMMSHAFRVHGMRSGVVSVVFLAFLGFATFLFGQIVEREEVARVKGLVGRLASAEPSQLSQIVEELDANPKVAATFLTPLVLSAAETTNEKRSQLHARLATVSRDNSLVKPLLEELLTNKVAYIGPIRQQLRPYAGELTEQLQTILRDETNEPNRRFRAAVMLADYVPQSHAAFWTEPDLRFVAGQLVAANAEFQPLLREYLRPIRGRLLASLETIFGDPKATDAQRLGAANAFADYAGSDVAKLSQLLVISNLEQYGVIYPLVAATPAATLVDDLGKIAATLPAAKLGSVERVPFGQHRANAAVTLLRLGERKKVLPVFEMTDDPEALTQFIFDCRDRGVRVEELLECLRLVSGDSVDRHPRNARYALLLALGEYTLDKIPRDQREPLLKQLSDWYRHDPSSGVHGAAGWLLRQWGQDEVVRQTDQTPIQYSADREWFTLEISVTPTPAQETSAAPLPQKTFYYTFIVFKAGDFEIGSFGDEPERHKDEVRHRVTLTRPFAILDREIRMEELIAFNPMYESFMQQVDGKPGDAGFNTNWYEAVGFCRWLGQQSGFAEEDQAYAAPDLLDEENYPRESTLSEEWVPRDWPLDLGRRGFRLPTEAEWEIASRAGARTAYGHGSDVALLSRFGWFVENSTKRMHPPQELRPGTRGLYDLHGNQFEWTHDWHGAYGGEATTDPDGIKTGSSRVTRGGSWNNGAAFCRSAFRSTDDPTLRSDDFGFRLVLSSPSALSPEDGTVK